MQGEIRRREERADEEKRFENWKMQHCTWKRACRENLPWTQLGAQCQRIKNDATMPRIANHNWSQNAAMTKAVTNM
jgi:hypothetical protein